MKDRKAGWAKKSWVPSAVQRKHHPAYKPPTPLTAPGSSLMSIWLVLLSGCFTQSGWSLKFTGAYNLGRRRLKEIPNHLNVPDCSDVYSSSWWASVPELPHRQEGSGGGLWTATVRCFTPSPMSKTNNYLDYTITAQSSTSWALFFSLSLLFLIADILTNLVFLYLSKMFFFPLLHSNCFFFNKINVFYIV